MHLMKLLELLSTLLHICLAYAWMSWGSRYLCFVFNHSDGLLSSSTNIFLSICGDGGRSKTLRETSDKVVLKLVSRDFLSLISLFEYLRTFLGFSLNLWGFVWDNFSMYLYIFWVSFVWGLCPVASRRIIYWKITRNSASQFEHAVTQATPINEF